MEVTLEAVSVDHLRGTATATMSSQETKRMMNALWELLGEVPGDACRSRTGIDQDVVHAIAVDLGEAWLTIPSQPQHP